MNEFEFVIEDDETIRKWKEEKPSSDYAQGIDVVQIGNAYFITVPYGAGAKRLQLTRAQFADIALKINATIRTPGTHKVNGVPVSREKVLGVVRSRRS